MSWLKTKNLAADRAASANRIAERHRKGLASTEKRLRKAEASGDAAKAEQASQRRAKQRKWIRNAERKAERYGSNARLGERAAMTAAKAAAEKKREAEQTAGAAKARKSIRKEKHRLTTDVESRQRLNRSDATPERLLRADGHQAIGADLVRRITDSPIDRLMSKQQLDPRDEVANRTLHEAAEIYRRDWYKAGLSGIGGMDMSRTGGGDGAPSWGMPNSEQAAHHRWRYHRAAAAIDPYLRAVVDEVVLRESDLDAAGRMVSGRTDRKQAQAVALDRLREGLRRLAIHYGIMKGHLTMVDRVAQDSGGIDSCARP